VSKTYRGTEKQRWSHTRSHEAQRSDASGEQDFRCRHCRLLVGPLPSGGRHRNHCPVCLYSRHVDDRRPGDRASTCGASMAPIGVFVRSNGEHVVLHRCHGCDRERFNRIAADDDFALVLSLPPVAAQRAGRRPSVPAERSA
jgi:hypothetical protein